MIHKTVIETSGLKTGYSRKTIISEGLELRLMTGQLTSLLGLNGAGKSTLLRTVCGFLPALGGEIRIMGRPLTDYSKSELSTVIGVVLTERTNAGGITVRELVSLGRYPYTGFFGTLGKEDITIVEEALEAAGMTHKAESSVSELSDGERQKVMIAKVLAQQCPIIVLDEPTAFLDVTSRIETITLLRRLATEQGKAVLMSSHDLELAIRMSDCLWMMEKGRPLVCGAPEDLILNGTFGDFFNKGNIRFDASTGKLTADRHLQPVAIEGDFNTAYWIGNALIRNGFQPVAADGASVAVHCFSPDRIVVSVASSPEKVEARSVDEMVDLVLETVS
jgi:iron complex transport system ATP-binding protein